jgi:hypothetical protein
MPSGELIRRAARQPRTPPIRCGASFRMRLTVIVDRAQGAARGAAVVAFAPPVLMPRFARDSLLEGDGFESPVPQQIRSRFRESSHFSRFDGLATRNRKFESISLQRRVGCELNLAIRPCSPVGAPAALAAGDHYREMAGKLRELARLARTPGIRTTRRSREAVRPARRSSRPPATLGNSASRPPRRHGRRRGFRTRHGTADLGRRLVLARAFIDDRPQQIVPGPGEIFDLGGQLGPYPRVLLAASAGTAIR